MEQEAAYFLNKQGNDKRYWQRRNRNCKNRLAWQEEIDLGSLNFDTDKVAKSLLDVRIKIDEMKDSLNQNKKAMRESQKGVEQLESSSLK